MVEASNRVPLKVTANTGKVALRWPKSPVVEQLIDEFGGPITGTSANISGFPACANTDQLMRQLGLRLPLVLDAGETGMGLPSTIIGLHDENWEVLREGAIPISEIEAVWPEVLERPRSTRRVDSVLPHGLRFYLHSYR